MLVSCPKCKVSYAIEADRIPENGRKLRCAKCGEIWVCYKADLFEAEEEQKSPLEEKVEETAASENAETQAVETKNPAETDSPVETDGAVEPAETNTDPEPAAEPEVPAPDDMKEIFARLSQQTENIFAEEKALPIHERFWTRAKFALGLHKTANKVYFAGTFLLLFLLLMFYVRFDVVRLMPCMEKVYSAVGIVSRIPGEGLEFQNVIRNEYEEDYVRKLEIKGFLANTKSQTINVPAIRVELLDKETDMLYEQEQDAPLKRLGAGSRMAFRIVITKPHLMTKYIYLTLVDKK